MEDLRVDSGVDECAEEHVSADTGEAVEIGDSHGGHCFTEQMGMGRHSNFKKRR